MIGPIYTLFFSKFVYIFKNYIQKKELFEIEFRAEDDMVSYERHTRESWCACVVYFPKDGICNWCFFLVHSIFCALTYLRGRVQKCRVSQEFELLPDDLSSKFWSTTNLEKNFSETSFKKFILFIRSFYAEGGVVSYDYHIRESWYACVAYHPKDGIHNWWFFLVHSIFCALTYLRGRVQKCRVSQELELLPTDHSPNFFTSG